jgi:hypothetical protein
MKEINRFTLWLIALNDATDSLENSLRFYSHSFGNKLLIQPVGEYKNDFIGFRDFCIERFALNNCNKETKNYGNYDNHIFMQSSNYLFSYAIVRFMCVFTAGRSSDEVASNNELKKYRDKIEQELFSYSPLPILENFESNVSNNPEIAEIVQKIKTDFKTKVETRQMFIDTLAKVTNIRHTVVAHQDGEHVNPQFKSTENGSTYSHASQMLDIEIAIKLLYVIPRMKIMINEFIYPQNNNT